MHQSALIAALTAALAAMPSAQAGMYTKGSPVVQATAKNFDNIVSKSNHTSIVEFYAPWCGHCQNLKPAYEKAARNLEGLAKVVAVDCDDDVNKPLCGAQGVQGFPTLKTFRPGKKSGKPIVEDYRGQRTASAITEEVVNKINNHVSKLTDDDADKFLSKGGPKAVLFTEKGTTSALLRSIAIDFLDVIKIGQVRSKEKGTVEKFGIEKFPTLVLIPEGDNAEPIVYEGELNKKDMVEFLKQAGAPNPDTSPNRAKAEKSTPGKKDKKDKKASKPKDETSTAEPEEAPESSTADATTAPAATAIPPTPIISDEMLAENCLHPKSHSCLLAIVSADAKETAEKTLEPVSKLNTKHVHGLRQIMPFFTVSGDVKAESNLRSTLGLTRELELIAVSARRKWWRQYEGDFSQESISAWLDGIRLGESAKKTLPKELIVEEVSEKTPEESSSEATQATDPEPEAETEAPEPEEEKIVHGEL